MNDTIERNAVKLFVRGENPAQPSSQTNIPALNCERLTRFWTAIKPLTTYLHSVHGTDEGSVGVFVGPHARAEAGDNSYYCDISSETHYSKELQQARGAFRDLEVYGRTNQQLLPLTFQVREGLDVVFPSGGTAAYCVLRIMVPDVPDGTLLADYIHGVVNFLKLKRPLAKRETHSETLLDCAGLRSLEQAWARLHARRDAGSERRQELSDHLAKLPPRMLKPLA